LKHWSNGVLEYWSIGVLPRIRLWKFHTATPHCVAVYKHTSETS
jgi:hypothetical protein